MWSIILFILFQTLIQRDIKPCKNGLEKTHITINIWYLWNYQKTIMAGSDIQEDWEATHV